MFDQFGPVFATGLPNARFVRPAFHCACGAAVTGFSFGRLFDLVFLLIKAPNKSFCGRDSASPASETEAGRVLFATPEG